MDSTTKATSEGIDTQLQTHLSEMEAKPPATDTIPIPIPLNDEALASQTRLQSLKDEIADLQARLGDLKAKASKAGHQATNAVKNGAKRADDSAHEQLGAYPWAKLAAAAVTTVVGTRLLKMLPLGGILSLAAPLVISQIKARNSRGAK